MKLGDVLDRSGVDTLGVLDREVDVPILSGPQPQRQGDVTVLCRPVLSPATTPIPQDGVVVVRGMNTHSLHSWDGRCFYDPAPAGDGLVLGTLTVPTGGSAYLIHSEEHGANAMGPGTYELHGKREWAGEWRRVAD